MKHQEGRTYESEGRAKTKHIGVKSVGGVGEEEV